MAWVSLHLCWQVLPVSPALTCLGPAREHHQVRQYVARFGVAAMMTETADEIKFDSISAAEDANAGPVTKLDNLPVRAVPLNTLGPGFFQRQLGTDASHVQLLADAANSDELPAILIQKSSLRIVDGMHRIEAAKLRGQQSINARFVDCTDEEAFILAVKSN